MNAFVNSSWTTLGWQPLGYFALIRCTSFDERRRLFNKNFHTSANVFIVCKLLLSLQIDMDFLEPEVGSFVEVSTIEDDLHTVPELTDESNEDDSFMLVPSKDCMPAALDKHTQEETAFLLRSMRKVLQYKVQSHPPSWQPQLIKKALYSLWPALRHAIRPSGSPGCVASAATVWNLWQEIQKVMPRRGTQGGGAWGWGWQVRLQYWGVPAELHSENEAPDAYESPYWGHAIPVSKLLQILWG